MLTVAAGALAHLVSNAGELAPVIGASAGISGAMAAAARFVFEPGGPLDALASRSGDRRPGAAAPLRGALRNPRVLTFLARLVRAQSAVRLRGMDFGSPPTRPSPGRPISAALSPGLLLFSAFDPIGPGRSVGRAPHRRSHIQIAATA